MSKVMKVEGVLTLGPARHDRNSAVYKYIRVGGTYLERVKVVGELDTLLQPGKTCTLWVVQILTPTPFIFRTKIHMVYAVEINGNVHKAISAVKSGWTASKWLGVLAFLGVGGMTLLLYIGLLFWICAVRLSFVELPLAEMEGEPA
jgi:hypothetical protein